MPKRSWFQTGAEGVARTKAHMEEQQRRLESSGPRRFYLKYDTSAMVTFLDNMTFFLFEHNMKIGNNYHNYFTCIQDMDNCPLCDADNNPSRIGVATVINHAEWVDNKGNTHKNEKQLFVCKGTALEKMLRQIDKRDGDLAFCVYDMARGKTKNECATGEDFEWRGRVSKAKLKAAKNIIPEGANPDEFLTPFNYQEIFAPKSTEELRKIAGGEAPVGGEKQDGETGSDLPFEVDDKKTETTEAAPENASSIEDLL